MGTERVLVVDQDAAHTAYLCLALEFEGFEAVTSSTAAEALAVLRRESFDVVAVDLRTARGSRPDVVDFVLQHLGGLPVIVLADPDDVGLAVEALGHGAFDFFTKPVQPEVVVHAVQRAARHSALQQEATIYRLSRVVFEIDDPDVLLDEITLLARRALSADLAAVLRPTAEGLRPEFAAWSDRTGGAPLPLEALTGLGARAVAAREPQLGQDGHVLAVPVTTRRATGVVLALAREETRRAFFRPDVETASLVASQAALALDNAFLVSELRRRVEQLDGAHRRLSTRDHLEAIGQLAVGLSHHLQDPLLYVRRHLDGAVAQLDAVERQVTTDARHPLVTELRRSLEYAGDGLDRVDRDVTDLTRFASGPRPAEIDTPDLVDAALRMAGAGSDVQVEVQPAVVQGNLAELALALAHLVRNARASATVDEAFVRVRGGFDGDRVWFDVEDNGAGMPARVIASLAANTPIPESGLQRCQRIVTQHGGALTVLPREGGGTRVRVTLRGTARPELSLGDD